jgi:hypothetical protein
MCTGVRTAKRDGLSSLRSCHGSDRRDRCPWFANNVDRVLRSATAERESIAQRPTKSVRNPLFGAHHNQNAAGFPQVTVRLRLDRPCRKIRPSLYRPSFSLITPCNATGISFNRGFILGAHWVVREWKLLLRAK